MPVYFIMLFTFCISLEAQVSRNPGFIGDFCLPVCSAVSHPSPLPVLPCLPTCSCGFLRKMQKEGISCSSINAAVNQKLFFNNWELFGESSKQKIEGDLARGKIHRFFFIYIYMVKGDREGKACSLKKKKNRILSWDY